LISTRQPKWFKIGLSRFMTMARQVHCFRKSCQRFKLHPLLFKLHLNFAMSLWSQSPWSISTLKVFCFLFIVWSDANKCSNSLWLSCASSTSYVQSWWISCFRSTFDVYLSSLDVRGVYWMSQGEHPTWAGLNKFSMPLSKVPFNAP
jgi:hypothetical protein